MDESAWVSVQVFHHGDLDDLLVDAVGPLATDLAEAGLIRLWFFQRHWDGGPQIRLRLLPDGPIVRQEVENVARQQFERYLRRLPPGEPMTQREYGALAPEAARRERQPHYERRLRPDATIAFPPYRRDHDRYGYGETIDAVERHFAESSRIALRVLGLGPPRHQRASTALALILISQFCSGADPDPAGETSPEGQRHLELARRMQALVLAVEALEDQFGTLVEWARSLTLLRNELASTGGPDAAAVLDSCAHLVCNRLGVPGDVELALRRLAHGAVAALARETVVS